MTTAITARLVPGHVGLNVSDLQRSTDFYCHALGFEQLAASSDDAKRWVFLGVDDKVTLTLWQQSSGTFSTATPGLHHLAFEVDSIEQVRAVESTLREFAVEFAHDGVVAHGEGLDSGGIFFTDPDGIRLEVYAPRGVEPAPAPDGEAPTCGFF